MLLLLLLLLIIIHIIIILLVVIYLAIVIIKSINIMTIIIGAVLHEVHALHGADPPLAADHDVLVGLR